MEGGVDACSNKTLDPNLHVLVDSRKAQIQEQPTMTLRFIALVTLWEVPHTAMKGIRVPLICPLRHLHALH